MIKAQSIFHGLSDKHSGLLITTSLEGCTHRLADVGNRVHTRNDSDEDVRGNAYKQTNSLEGFTLIFHYSNILSAVNISESFSLSLGYRKDFELSA